MARDSFFITIAEAVATGSKDRSTQVGAVLVRDGVILSTGYNGFVRGAPDDDPALHERPAKYRWTAHAEQNAIFNAARVGTPTVGATLYLNFAPCPCGECAKAIIQAGIVAIVGPDRPFTGASPHWTEDIQFATGMLKGLGITMRTVAAPGACG
jgi:dCMP deaminase